MLTVLGSRRVPFKCEVPSFQGYTAVGAVSVDKSLCQVYPLNQCHDIQAKQVALEDINVHVSIASHVWWRSVGLHTAMHASVAMETASGAWLTVDSDFEIHTNVVLPLTSLK